MLRGLGARGSSLSNGPARAPRLHAQASPTVSSQFRAASAHKSNPIRRWHAPLSPTLVPWACSFLPVGGQPAVTVEQMENSHRLAGPEQVQLTDRPGGQLQKAVGRGGGVVHVRCTVAGCGRRHYAKGFCSSHYRKKRRLEGPRCSVPGCDRKAYARGRCEGHDKTPIRIIRPVRAEHARPRAGLGPALRAALIVARGGGRSPASPAQPRWTDERSHRPVGQGPEERRVAEEQPRSMRVPGLPAAALLPRPLSDAPRPASAGQGSDADPPLRARRGVRGLRASAADARAVEAAPADRRVAGHPGRRAGAPGAGGGAAVGIPLVTIGRSFSSSTGPGAAAPPRSAMAASSSASACAVPRGRSAPLARQQVSSLDTRRGLDDRALTTLAVMQGAAWGSDEARFSQ